MEKRIKFKDGMHQVGLANVLIRAFDAMEIKILTMEMGQTADGGIDVKAAWPDSMSWNDFCIRIKKEVPQLRELLEVEWMDYEKRIMELELVINNVDEAIITTDNEGIITFCNEKAARALSRETQGNLRGSHINSIIPVQQIDLDSFQGEKRNIELVYRRNNKKEMALADILQIRNGPDRREGYMIIVKDMSKVRKLLHTLSGPRMNTFDDIIGNSRSIKNAINMARQAASSNSNILLMGESGTGKELFARAIHQSSRRNEGPFITANCAAIPDPLLESELFGYERGAFTGADSGGKQGLFELAMEGTLFLDEIGDMNLHLQAKMLRAIQERKIRRVGGIREIDINTRIISATNKNLEEMVKLGTFRNDLYFRLNVIPIYIPPLRQRKEDIPMLTESFLSIIAQEAEKPDIRLVEGVMDKLMGYDWPGNIRELRNVIERAVYLAADCIESRHLMLEAQSYHEAMPIPAETAPAEDAASGLPIRLPERLAELERYYLRKAMASQKSSRGIAKLLGISHTSVVQKIKHYHLDQQET